MGGMVSALSANNGDLVRLTRAPYIQQCSPDSVIISWKTNKPVPTAIDFDTDYDYQGFIHDPRETDFHTVTLRNLQSDQMYFYRVTFDERTLYAGHFKTYPRKDDAGYESFAFFALGDGGRADEHQQEVRDQIQRYVLENKVDFGIYMGDIVYNDGDEFAQDPTYFTPYQNIIDRLVIWPTVGNHDLHAEEGAPYFRNRILPEPEEFRSQKFPERWYAFRYGPALFIALDSTIPDDETQIKFLRRTIKQHKDARWKFVNMHHPPYATPYADKEGCSHVSEKKIRRKFSPYFEHYNVDMVFSGHNHTYQRSKLRKDFISTSKGVYYIVSGGGGRGIHAVNPNDYDCQSPPLEQAAVQGNTYHFVHVGVDGLTLTLEGVSEKGEIFDSFKYTKELPGNASE